MEIGIHYIIIITFGQKTTTYRNRIRRFEEYGVRKSQEKVFHMHNMRLDN
jgi:hypothetical protein